MVGFTSARDAPALVAGSLELGSLTALPLRAQPLRFISSLCFLNLSLLTDSLLPCSSFPGGDDWASGGAICPVFAQPFAGDERILQVCPPLLFPSAVRDGAPQTLTKLFVFGSESSYNILPTNFDFVCKNYRVYMCTPMSDAGSTPGGGEENGLE
jgi:hypothetical protein